MSRQEFTAKTKLAAFDASGGCCVSCGCKLIGGRSPEYDHRIPCALGGDNSVENCDVLCRPCHRAKTSGADVPTIAKAKRVRAKHVGAKKPKSQFATARDGKWKAKIGGGAVLRSEE